MQVSCSRPIEEPQALRGPLQRLTDPPIEDLPGGRCSSLDRTRACPLTCEDAPQPGPSIAIPELSQSSTITLLPSFASEARNLWIARPFYHDLNQPNRQRCWFCPKIGLEGMRCLIGWVGSYVAHADAQCTAVLVGSNLWSPERKLRNSYNRSRNQIRLQRNKQANSKERHH